MRNATMRKLQPLTTFTVLDDSNTAIVTMNNPRNGNSECVSTLADVRAIASAVLGFAIRQHLPPTAVEVSVKWPDGVSHA